MRIKYKYIHFKKIGNSEWHCINKGKNDLAIINSYYSVPEKLLIGLKTRGGYILDANSVGDIFDFMKQLERKNE